MPNELILICSVVFIYGAALLGYKFFGKTGLYCISVIATILANIEVTIMINAFGMEQTLGNVLFAVTFLITDISVVSMTRFMNNTQAMSKPTSIATVKSKITVKKKVINSTVTSDFGFFSNALKVRQPLML